MHLSVKEGGCGFHSHFTYDLRKFYVGSALLASPTVAAATGLVVGQCFLENTPPASVSEQILANSVHLLERAGIPAPDFAYGGPVEADTYLHAVAQTFGEFHRSELCRLFEEADDDASKARLLSCGGVGAQWLVSLPTDPRLCFEDDDFVSVVRLRLGLDTFTAGRCPHVNADGVPCTDVCDRQGRHLFKCQTGGGWIMAHDSTLAEYCHLVMGSDGIPGAEVEWKPHVSAWPRRTRDAEADVGFYRLPGMRDTYVDGVISYADPATYPGCESTPGHVAELKKRDKHRDHPVFDARYRRQVPFDFVALSFERHGRWAKETVSFTKETVPLPRVWSPQKDPPLVRCDCLCDPAGEREDLARGAGACFGLGSSGVAALGFWLRPRPKRRRGLTRFARRARVAVKVFLTEPGLGVVTFFGHV